MAYARMCRIIDTAESERELWVATRTGLPLPAVLTIKRVSVRTHLVFFAS